MQKTYSIHKSRRDDGWSHRNEGFYILEHGRRPRIVQFAKTEEQAAESLAYLEQEEAERQKRMAARRQERRKKYRVNLDAFTICAVDEHGETRDLNATGHPIRNGEELKDFIRTLGSEGAFDRATENGLLDYVEAAQ